MMSSERAYDVVIVGSGVAGMMAALSAATEAGVKVALLTDRHLGQSNSAMAQGGIQCPDDSIASRESYKRDIERSARTELSDELLNAFVAEARDAVLALVALGLKPDTGADGGWKKRAAGGISEPRAIGVGDRVGAAMVKVLRQAVKADARIAVLDSCLVTGLEKAGGMFHLACRRHDRDERVTGLAVVVCTGGTSYRESERTGMPTTNPCNSNHLLYDFLKAFGLREVHADTFQYHPLGIIVGPSMKCKQAFPESVLALPATIVDRNDAPLKQAGERIDRLDLSMRMFAAEKQGLGVAHPQGVTGFWLNLGAIGDAELRKGYPASVDYLERNGLDPRRFLVRPFLHYQTGGFWFDRDCQSSEPGLFLAGEITGGVHGRNRLFGNGLTDAVTHGRRAGISAARFVRGSRGKIDGGMTHV